MTLDEVRELISEGEATLGVLRVGFRAAMTAIRTEPLEIEVTVFHDHGERQVRKPNPALRRSRELTAAMRALEKQLKQLRVEETALAFVKKTEESHWAQFAPKEKKE